MEGLKPRYISLEIHLSRYLGKPFIHADMILREKEQNKEQKTKQSK
jgi:hypothetical protein